MARPTIFDSPMTPAERMRRYRARKTENRPPSATLDEALARCTRKEQAAYVNRSVRHWYHVAAFTRLSEIAWDGDILDGKHGKVGMAFLAEVCQYGDATAQQAVHDEIKAHGAAAGRALWVNLVFEDARRSGRWAIAHRVNRRLNRH